MKMKRFSGGLGERLEIASIQQLARFVLFLFVCVCVGGGALWRASPRQSTAPARSLMLWERIKTLDDVLWLVGWLIHPTFPGTISRGGWESQQPETGKSTTLRPSHLIMTLCGKGGRTLVRFSFPANDEFVALYFISLFFWGGGSPLATICTNFCLTLTRVSLVGQCRCTVEKAFVSLVCLRNRKKKKHFGVEWGNRVMRNGPSWTGTCSTYKMDFSHAAAAINLKLQYMAIASFFCVSLTTWRKMSVERRWKLLVRFAR